MQGYEVVRELSFPDHHWYTTSDLERIGAAVRATGADLIATTEKDAVRLPRLTAWAVLADDGDHRAGRSVLLMARGPVVRYRVEFAIVRRCRRSCGSCR